MRVTKWGECGILCALYLARRFEAGPTGAVEIAKEQALDLQYTQQILQRLRKGGIIESERGPHGGYRLSRPPEVTNLKEILHAAEGDTFQVICDTAPIHPQGDDSPFCSTRDTCGLHHVWQGLRTTIDTFLESKTLADLMAQQERLDSLVQLGKRGDPTTPRTP